MTEKKKYAPQNQADPHGYGLPDPRERILTAAEMNDLPKDVVLKYAFSQQFEDARKERERLAAMQQPAKTFSPEEIAKMDLADLLAMRDAHKGGQG